MREKFAQTKADAEPSTHEKDAQQTAEITHLEKEIETALVWGNWKQAKRLINQLENMGPRAQRAAERYKMRLPKIWQRIPTWIWGAGVVVLVVLGIMIFRQLQLERISQPAGVAQQKTELSPADVMGMVLLPAGEFNMGSVTVDADERPVHTVYLGSFWIDQYEVTYSQFQQFIQADNYSAEPCAPGDDHPVACINWYASQAYCQWAGRRLPTEAEWEKAARGGLEGALYPWGDQSPVCTAGEENGAQFQHCDGKTVAVGSFAPNNYGLYDISGNVSEWVSSIYKSYPFDPTDGRENVESDKDRVFRGGSWQYNGYILRVANRNYTVPSNSTKRLGFRCALSAEYP